MKKQFLVLIAVFMLLFALNTYSLACDKGCTPGFWKQPQHTNQWNRYQPGETLQEVFGCGSNIPLLEALSTGGGGIYALQRHAVAALLNAAELPCFDFTEDQVKTDFCAALNNGMLIESQKNLFEAENDGVCALNRKRSNGGMPE